MEKIEEDFYGIYESGGVYLDSRKDDASSIVSDTFSIDLPERTNIHNHDDSEKKERKNRLKQYILHWYYPR